MRLFTTPQEEMQAAIGAAIDAAEDLKNIRIGKDDPVDMQATALLRAEQILINLREAAKAGLKSRETVAKQIAEYVETLDKNTSLDQFTGGDQ
ncbi:MAG: hypothetical protein M0Q43_13325 [Methanothrix sp.]|jgi:hypothetical protein|nr:hypothetical protein [Methanothrix sp.]